MADADFHSKYTGEQIEEILDGAVLDNRFKQTTATQRARARANIGVNANEMQVVSYQIPQNLTKAEKAQARANIGAGSSDIGLVIKGYYPTLQALRESVVGSEGDTYGVGTAYPYDIYIWDDVNKTWVNNGNIRGADGTDADVTAENIEAALGFTPLNPDNALTLEEIAASTDLTGKVAAAQAASDLSWLLGDGAGLHNSLYRGKYLGNSVTAAQYAAIANGSFKDLYIGDYWTIGGVNYRIAHFDYYLKCGDVSCDTHHALIIPDSRLYTAQMNTSNVTTGGYKGSAMYATNLAQAKTTINAAFGGHVLSHRIFITNATSNGRASGGEWVDSTVDLMTEQMVYGTGIFSPVSDGSSVPANQRVEKSQVALFRHDPSFIVTRSTWWLRDVISAAFFAYVVGYGSATYDNASSYDGVRPAFCIYGG